MAHSNALGVLPLLGRRIFRVSGPDAAEYLQGLITADIKKATPKQAIFAALLTPQGKVLFDFFILAQDDGYVLDTAEPLAEALFKRLKMYKLRRKVELSEEPHLAVAAQLPGGEDVLIAELNPFDDPRSPALGRRLIATKADIEALPLSGDEAAFYALRQGLGFGELPAEIQADQDFAHETNYPAMNGVAYDKGCFVGQEVLARMKHRGTVRKRLLGVRGTTGISGSGPLEPGAPVMAGEKKLGEIRSAQDTPEGPLGFAMLRLDHLKAALDAGTPLHAGAAPIEVTLPGWLDLPSPATQTDTNTNTGTAESA